MKTKLLIISLMFSSSVFARTDCPVAKIDHIQIEANVVLYQQTGYGWRSLGPLSGEGTKERYSALLAAQMSGKKVMVAYLSDSYDCNTTNFGDSAYIVRTYND